MSSGETSRRLETSPVQGLRDFRGDEGTSASPALPGTSALLPPQLCYLSELSAAGRRLWPGGATWPVAAQAPAVTPCYPGAAATRPPACRRWPVAAGPPPILALAEDGERDPGGAPRMWA